jgi:hypothetical protein
VCDITMTAQKATFVYINAASDAASILS